LIHDVIGFFNLPNSSSHTMAPGLTQLLSEMSTNNLPGGAKGGKHVRLTTLPSSVSQLCRNCDSLESSQPYGPSKPVPGIGFVFFLDSVFTVAPYQGINNNYYQYHYSMDSHWLKHVKRFTL
jgi:hypothetical protein